MTVENTPSPEGGEQKAEVVPFEAPRDANYYRRVALLETLTLEDARLLILLAADDLDGA